MRGTLVIVAVLLLTPLPALQAKELAGVTMPDKLAISGRESSLVGMGVRTIFFIKVYVGGLYMAEPARDERVVISSDQPKRLVLHFVHSKVEKDKLLTAWREGFEKNSGPHLAALKGRIDRFNSFFDSDVKSGEEAVITYLPSIGTEVVFRGASKGVIEGKDFMEALFKIWFGDKPADSGLKLGLLGKGQCRSDYSPQMVRLGKAIVLNRTPVGD